MRADESGQVKDAEAAIDVGRPPGLARAFAVVLLVGLLVGAAGTVAFAQTADALSRSVRDSAVVTVTFDGEAEPVRGILRDISDSALTLDTDGGLRHFEMATVRKVDRKGDSLVNGTLIGAIVLGGWCAAVCGQGTGGSLSYGAVVVGNAAIGAGIGALIDAARDGQTTVYRRPMERQARRSGATIRVTFRF